MQVEEWHRQIEKILNVMECTESQRVTFTTFMCQREAENWREMVKSRAKSAGKELTWHFLVKKFNENISQG